MVIEARRAADDAAKDRVKLLELSQRDRFAGAL
jgi:hypothetical protein